MNDDYERSLITYVNIEAHTEADKVNMSLQVEIIGASWFLYDELMSAFRSLKNVEVGISLESE